MAKYRIFLDKNFYHFLLNNDEGCSLILTEIASICHTLVAAGTTARRFSTLLDELTGTNQTILNLISNMFRTSKKIVFDWNVLNVPIDNQQEAIKAVKDEDAAVIGELKVMQGDIFVTFDKDFAVYLASSQQLHQIECQVFLLPHEHEGVIRRLKE